MDDRINNICSLFYASHYIPLAVYEERAIVHIFSSAGSSLDLFSLFEAQSFSAEQTMYILTLPEQGTYGQIRIKKQPDESTSRSGFSDAYHGRYGYDCCAKKFNG